MTDKSIAEKIFADLVAKLFDVRIIGNQYRSHYVERLVVIGLGDGFEVVSDDWGGWDIEHESGLRIEVKQSAAHQTWTQNLARAKKPAAGSFDIAPRTGYWTNRGATWVSAPGRHADIYIFAWHPIADAAAADHRDPAQWQFFVVPTVELPERQKTISRKVVEQRWQAVGFDKLRKATLNRTGNMGA